MLVEQVDLGVADRFADGDALAGFYSCDAVGGRKGGGFGWTVAIQQLLWRVLAQDFVDHTRIKGVAADDQGAQSRQDAGQGGGVVVEQTDGHPHEGDALVFQFCRETLG